jgi:hypothetical protein
MPRKHIARSTVRLALAFTLFSSVVQADPAAGPNLLGDLNGMDDTPYIDNPWGGVSNGVITLNPGVQLAVNEDGAIQPTIFGPSCSVGDLNGDGLPDLVVADAKGYFWYFPNSGTPTKPKFTSGEVMPIWIGVPLLGGNGAGIDPTDDQAMVRANYDAVDNTVPRIQLVDYAGDKKLSLVVGNYEGKLFYVHNLGSFNQPAFAMPNDLSAITVDTYSKGFLWCNFLAPFLYDFTGNGQLDLVLGEGTYASNSIYRLANKGSNPSPIFNDRFTTKIIPGYGREHLTPQVVDWDGDGKPDVIAGERQGYIDFWKNTSPDSDPAHLQFDTQNPQHVKFGGIEQFGLLTTVAVCDLTGNKLPNLIISNSDQRLSYALNKGKPGAPRFDAPVPIQGVNPYPKIFAAPENWKIFKGFSMPYLLLCSTKLRDDPSFKPPDDAPTIKSALKIYTVPHQHTYFPKEIFPANDAHIVVYDQNVTLEAGTHYDLSFYCKTAGNVENLRYFLFGRENLVAQGIVLSDGSKDRWNFIENNIDSGADWVQVKGDIMIEKADPDKNDNPPVRFYFAFNGTGGTVWVTGFSLTKRAR